MIGHFWEVAQSGDKKRSRYLGTIGWPERLGLLAGLCGLCRVQLLAFDFGPGTSRKSGQNTRTRRIRHTTHSFCILILTPPAIVDHPKNTASRSYLYGDQLDQFFAITQVRMRLAGALAFFFFWPAVHPLLRGPHEVLMSSCARRMFMLMLVSIFIQLLSRGTVSSGVSRCAQPSPSAFHTVGGGCLYQTNQY